MAASAVLPAEIRKCPPTKGRASILRVLVISLKSWLEKLVVVVANTSSIPMIAS